MCLKTEPTETPLGHRWATLFAQISVVLMAKIVEDYAQQLGDWWYNNLDAEQAYLKKHRADKLPDEFAGMVRRAEAARRRAS